MPRYLISTLVEYSYEVEADNETDAEKQGLNYQNYPYAATVDSIEVDELEEEDDDEDGDE
jgi:hypothetical protein